VNSAPPRIGIKLRGGCKGPDVLNYRSREGEREDDPDGGNPLRGYTEGGSLGSKMEDPKTPFRGERLVREGIHRRAQKRRDK